MILDSNLTYDEHIIKTASSCMFRHGQINCVKYAFDKRALLMIINSLFFSKLFCSSNVWANASKCKINTETAGCAKVRLPHPLELQIGSNPPPSRHVKATVQNFFPCVKPFIQMYIFCNKQLAAVWFKICVNCNFNDNRVISYIKIQLKYPKSLKPILISLKMLFLESPHSMGLLKGSQMLQQNSELIK